MPTKTKPPATFGARLRSLRNERGLTLAALAKLTDFEANAIARLERGERDPMLATALAMADALGVTLDWLAGRE